MALVNVGLIAAGGIVVRVFVVTQDESFLSIEWNKEFTLSDGEVINQGGASFTPAKYQGSSFTIAFTEDENGRSVSYSVSEAE